MISTEKVNDKPWFSVKKIFMSLLICLQSSFCLGASAWQEICEQDLTAASTFIKSHYPAFYLPESENQQTLHGKSWSQALEDLKNVKSYDNYLTTLQTFVASYKEPLLKIKPHFQPRTLSWPGFLVAYHQGVFKVAAVSNNKHAFQSLPPYGATLLSVDGISPENYINTHLLPQTPYQSSSQAYELLSPSIFLNSLAHTHPLIKECEFLYEGQSFFSPLNYKEEKNTNITPHLQKILYKNPYTITYKPFLEKGLWLTLPHFMPLSLSEEKLWDELIVSIESPENKDFLVIDLRGNSDLNLQKPLELFQAIYGLPTLSFYTPIKNRNSYLLLNPQSPYLPKDLKAYHYLQSATLFKHSQGFSTPLKAFASPIDSIKRRPLTIQEPKNFHFPTKIFLIIDAKTGGSSLLLLDFFLSMPNSVVIGSPTQASSAYCMPISQALPSGLVTLECPIGILVPFDRSKDFSYQPDYFFDQQDISVEKFVEDLAKEASKIEKKSL